MKGLLLALLIALVALSIAPGCGDDENPIVPQPPDRSSIENLLTEFFEVAYQSKDEAMYAEMLGADFEFEFLATDAQDLQDRSILQPGETSWDRDADLASTSRMFGSADVGGITLNITVDTTAVDTTCVGCQRVETTITLRVLTRPNDPDPFIFAVDSKQSFVVAKDPADASQWVVVRQYDSDLPAKGVGPSVGTGGFVKRIATEPTTWGAIKGIY